MRVLKGVKFKIEEHRGILGESSRTLVDNCRPLVDNSGVLEKNIHF